MNIYNFSNTKTQWRSFGQPTDIGYCHFPLQGHGEFIVKNPGQKDGEEVCVDIGSLEPVSRFHSLLEELKNNGFDSCCQTMKKQGMLSLSKF
jgi:hypothetical protein